MINVDAKQTGRRIKAKMYETGISSDALASKLGYSDRSTISRWTRGQSVPSYENLVNMAILFRCSVKDLVAFKQDNER